VEDKPLFVKIGDFGLAKRIGTPAGVQLTRSLCGTPSCKTPDSRPLREMRPFERHANSYFADVAPEVLADSATRRHGFPVDVWSCGVVLYICLCGFPPFSDELYNADFPYTLSQQIKMGRFDYPSPYWDPVGDPALDLIDSMIVVDPEQRFDIKQCQAHPWNRGSSRAASLTLVEDAVRSESPEIMGEVRDATAARWEGVIPLR
jgi:serine/threonine-protein kinase Chk2